MMKWPLNKARKPSKVTQLRSLSQKISSALSVRSIQRKLLSKLAALMALSTKSLNASTAAGLLNIIAET
jgi:hypothetical protein